MSGWADPRYQTGSNLPDIADRLQAVSHMQWGLCAENVAWNHCDEWLDGIPGHQVDIPDPHVCFLGIGRALEFWTQVLQT